MKHYRHFVGLYVLQFKFLSSSEWLKGKILYLPLGVFLFWPPARGVNTKKLNNTFYISRNYRPTNNAANKPKTDIERILDSMGIRNLGLKQTRMKSSALGAVLSFLSITKGLLLLPSKSYLVVQYPLSKYYNYITWGARLKGCKIVLVIHDVHSLMKGKLAVEKEMKRFNIADKIIVHNRSMKHWFEEQGCKAALETLELFDYLNTLDLKLEIPTEIQKPYQVVVAGGLTVDKSAFIYKMQQQSIKNYFFNLYGNGFSQENLDPEKGLLHYQGSFPPDEVAQHIKGHFGLVWGGNSVDKCSGILGEYLKYNNPHKTSLYLLCGLPIIIWDKAAIAPYIVSQGAGIAISSLLELDAILENLTLEDYQTMSKRAIELRDKVTNGGFLKAAITKLQL